jgi:hypothetical protein
MSEYRLIGIEKSDFSADRTDFRIMFRTDRGLLTVNLAAEHLAHLITDLENAEARSTLLIPKAEVSFRGCANPP